MLKRKSVIDEICIRTSTNACKLVVGKDASRLYPYPMCQLMPTGLYPKNEFDADLRRFKPHKNKTRSFENMVMSYFQGLRPDTRIEGFYATGNQKRIECFNADGFCGHCNTVFEAMSFFNIYCPCQEARPALTQKNNQRGTKKEGIG